jgi:hypothetical protein
MSWIFRFINFQWLCLSCFLNKHYFAYMIRFASVQWFKSQKEKKPLRLFGPQPSKNLDTKGQSQNSETAFLKGLAVAIIGNKKFCVSDAIPVLDFIKGFSKRIKSSAKTFCPCRTSSKVFYYFYFRNIS